MRKKVVSVILATLMAASLLAGCGSSEAATETAAEQETSGEAGAVEESAEASSVVIDDANADASGAKTGGVLKLGTAQSPSVVGYTPEITNNSFIEYLRCAYESLLYYDEDGNIIGQLASEWEADAENATLLFTLADGVTFSDGTAFNAEAVKWNIEKYQEAGRSEVNNVDSVDVIDEKTVQINLKEWNSSSLELVGFFIYYMSPTAYEEQGVEWLRSNSCGTGPFVVSGFEQGVSVSYTKNENYHVEGQPYLDGVEFTIYADATTLENSLRAGEIDVVTYADVDLWNNVQNDSNYTVDRNANGQGVESVGLIPSSADESDPFYDARVRQAFCYAVDWDTLVSSLSYGLYERTNQWAAPGSVTYNPNVVGYSYDPEKAKELLAEAGYADGFTTTLYVPGSTGFYANAAAVVSASLAEVGITANIETVDAAKGNDIMSNGWTGLYWHFASIGPDLGLYMGRHLDVDGAYYAKGIQHPDDCLDLLAQIRVATNDEEKIALEWELQEKIYDEYALFGEPLFVNSAVWIRSTDVKGGQFAVVHAATWSPATCWLDR
ncbi:MAG: ABC transporter substrate-binding protein [Eubacteriales bacterium]|nr:ABC transporter substrate-binding protein [Eubacteriales bacterium]